MKTSARSWRRTILWGALTVFATVGFRVYPGSNRWPIDASDKTIWVNFVTRPTLGNNDLPSGDPLFGQTLTFTSLTQSVFDDYQSVSTSYFRFADASTDPGYSAANATVRTVNVNFATTQIGQEGSAQQTVVNGRVVACSITMSSSALDSPKRFVSTLTHELGHCAGLDHPQETTHAIMSYFTGGIRLQDDDRMGLTYLYPVDPRFAEESADFGLACAPKD